MDIRQLFVIVADGRFQELFPKYCILFPARTQAFVIGDGQVVDCEDRELRKLGADARSHAKGEIRRIRQRSAQTPYLRQYLSQKGFALTFPKENCWAVSRRNASLARAHDSPPFELLEFQVQQEHWTGAGSLAGPLVHRAPEARLAVDHAALERVFRSTYRRQDFDASSVQLAQRRYCPQTGPPARRRRAALLFHFPYLGRGVGEGLSTVGFPRKPDLLGCDGGSR